MKDFFACSYTLNSTDDVIYAQVKTCMYANVVRALKHTIEGETCVWNSLKKRLKVAFGRKKIRYTDLHTEFFQRKKLNDE